MMKVQGKLYTLPAKMYHFVCIGMGESRGSLCPLGGEGDSASCRVGGGWGLRRDRGFLWGLPGLGIVDPKSCR